MANVYIIDIDNLSTILTNRFVSGHTVRIISDTSSTFESEVVYLTTVNKASGTKTTHVFNNDTGEILYDSNIYSVKIENTSGGTLIPADTMIYPTDDVPHTKVFGVCNCKCAVEVVDREEYVRRNTQIQNSITEIQNSIEDTGWVNFVNGTKTISDGNGRVTIDYIRARKIGNMVQVEGWVTAVIAKANGYINGITMCDVPVNFKPHTTYAFEHGNASLGSMDVYGSIKLDSTMRLYLQGINTAANYSEGFPFNFTYLAD